MGSVATKKCIPGAEGSESKVMLTYVNAFFRTTEFMREQSHCGGRRCRPSAFVCVGRCFGCTDRVLGSLHVDKRWGSQLQRSSRSSTPVQCAFCVCVPIDYYVCECTRKESSPRVPSCMWLVRGSQLLGGRKQRRACPMRLLVLVLFPTFISFQPWVFFVQKCFQIQAWFCNCWANNVLLWKPYS